MHSEGELAEDDYVFVASATVFRGKVIEVKNIQIDYSNKLILLDNMMQRMRELKNGGFALDGVITQAERNAIFVAISMLQRKRDELKVGGD